jgi:hypothetical protein
MKPKSAGSRTEVYLFRVPKTKTKPLTTKNNTLMNNLQLLTKAQNILVQSLENDAPKTAWETGFLALGLTHVDWDAAAKNILDFLQLQDSDGFLPYSSDANLIEKIIHPPIWGFVAWQLYLQAEDQEKATIFLKEVFPKIVHFHQYLYLSRDPHEEGLCYIQHPLEDVFENNPTWEVAEKTSQGNAYFKIYDPLFNTILAWSNESLIRIAEVLKSDVTELVQWEELTVHTFNEKLWDEEFGIYNAWDVVAGKVIPIESIAGLLPLAGWLPEISQALKMLDLINSESFAGTFEMPAFMCPSYSLTAENIDTNQKYQGAISMDLNWLLYYGLNQYETPEFLEAAEEIKRQSINILTKNGFRECFNPLQNNLNDAGLGKEDDSISAAILLNWLL